MESAVSLEKSVEYIFKRDIGEGIVYKGGRISAAAGFAADVVRMNQEVVTDRLGNFLCYSTALNSFVYALFKLKYSSAENAYAFDLRDSKPEDRLQVVG